MHNVLDPTKQQPATSQTIARQAVVEFNKQLRALTQTARALTGKPNLSVRITGGTPFTDGKNIYMRPPVELGLKRQHVRHLCDKRNPITLQQECEACQIREHVQATLYHEMAHNIEDSFQRAQDNPEHRAIIMKSIRTYHGGNTEMQERVQRRLKRYRERVGRPLGFMEIVSQISPYLTTVMNALEDGRINTRMAVVRPGLAVMFHSHTKAVFETGIQTAEGTTWWREQPPNAQAIILLFVKVMGYDPTGWLDDQIVADLNDPELDRLCEDVRYCEEASGVFALLFPIVARVKALGYLLDNTDPKPEEEDDDPLPGGSADPTQDNTTGDNPDEEDEPNGSDTATEPGPGDSAEVQVDEEGPDADAGDGEDPGDDDAGGSGVGSDDGEETADGSAADEGDDDSDPDESNGGDDLGGSTDGEEAGDGGVSDDVESAEGDDGEQVDGDGEGDGGDAADDDDEEGGSGGREGDTTDLDGPARESDEGDEAASDHGGRDDDDPASEEADEDATAGSSDDTRDGPDDGTDAQGADDSSDEDEDGEGFDPDADLTDPEDIEDVRRAVDHARGHDPDDSEHVVHAPPSGPHDDGIPEDRTADEDTDVPELEQREWERAISQVEHMDRESDFISKVAVIRPEDERWQGRAGTIEQPPESVMTPALAHMRRVFSENQKHKTERNLKRGRVDARALGRRAPFDDPRLMQRRTMPGKRDYFVLIGVDVSFSNLMNGTLPRVKSAVAAQADLLARIGVDFAIYAHSSDFEQVVDENGERIGVEVNLAIYEVKPRREPWNAEVRGRLGSLTPRGGNFDGHTMEFYRKRLAEVRDATDKILMYYCDGQMPDGNYQEELAILQDELAIMRKSGVKTMGVGIGSDSPIDHGLDTVLVMGDHDIPKVVQHLEKVIAK